jgi:hypothetical protein
MANEEHLAILKQGVGAWNKWREENPNIRPDLSEVKLSGAHLTEAHLRGADLSEALLEAYYLGAILVGADLRGANLRGARLMGAHLSEADLSGADLRGANLRGANLNGGDLTGANLSEADLSGARLSEANLTNCEITYTIFADVDLSTVKGLATAKHRGPSTIGIDTIYRSKGKIPDIFLRGAGVPANLIEYIPSLVGQAIQYYSCFISHSHSDQRFCARLYADLQARGVRVWYFPEDATWGRSVWGEIDRSIKIYDKLVVVCSEHSLQSGPVCREIERSLQREGKEVLFPVRLDNYLFDVWDHPRKADVLAKVVGDFRGWNRGAKRYDVAFDRLMKALQGEPTASEK